MIVLIKFCKGLYIHFLTVLLFIFGYINRNLEILCVSYGTIFLHEIAHLVAALALGLVPSHITLLPFGTNLKLKNSFVYSLSDEIILYLSGPLFNAVMCVFLLPFKSKTDILMLFYYNNLVLFFFNILPILPMDGGVVLKRILVHKVGSRMTGIYLQMVSVVTILFLIYIEIWLLVKNNFNFSILIVVIFLTGNIFTNKEKHHIELARELLFYKEKDKKKIKRVKGYLIKEDANLKQVIKNFSVESNYVIFKENENGKIGEILTEREIIEEILK